MNFGPFVYLNEAEACDPLNMLRILGVKVFGRKVSLSWCKSLRWWASFRFQVI